MSQSFKYSCNISLLFSGFARGQRCGDAWRWVHVSHYFHANFTFFAFIQALYSLFHYSKQNRKPLFSNAVLNHGPFRMNLSWERIDCLRARVCQANRYGRHFPDGDNFPSSVVPARIWKSWEKAESYRFDYSIFPPSSWAFHCFLLLDRVTKCNPNCFVTKISIWTMFLMNVFSSFADANKAVDIMSEADSIEGQSSGEFFFSFVSCLIKRQSANF